MAVSGSQVNTDLAEVSGTTTGRSVRPRSQPGTQPPWQGNVTTQPARRAERRHSALLALICYSQPPDGMPDTAGKLEERSGLSVVMGHHEQVTLVYSLLPRVRCCPLVSGAAPWCQVNVVLIF